MSYLRLTSSELPDAYLPHIGCWHCLFHLVIKNIALLLGEDIEDADGAVSTASRYVLVIVIVTNAECWRRCVTQRVLVSDLDI